MRKILTGMVVLILMTACAAETALRPPSPSVTPEPTAVSASPTATDQTSTSADSPSPAPTAEPALRLVWSEHGFSGSVSAVAADGDQLIAVGSDADGLAAWISTDGLEWERHTMPDPTRNTVASRGWSPGPIVRLGDTIFSFGTFDGVGDFRRPVGWRSVDGATWDYIESTSPFFDSGSVVHLTAGEAALLAVTDGGLIAPAQTAWRWTAQTSWTKTDLASSTDRPIAVHDIVWSAGTYVAVGSTYEPANAETWWEALEPLGWTSQDGQAWDPIGLPDGLRTGCAVAPLPEGGFLLLGLDANGPAAWTSSDGSSWASVPPLAGAWPEGCWEHVTPINGGFVAGLNAPGRDNPLLILLASADASTWSDTELPGLSTGDYRAAVLEEQVIVFGRKGTGDDTETVLLRGVRER